MPIKYLSNLSLELNELQNVVIQNLSGSLPGTPNVGRMAMGTTNDRMAWASSAGWHELYPFASTNTASTGVLRDGSGNFAAGTITASLTGNASTASALQTARNISISGKATATGVAFDGTASIALSVSALAVNPSDISVTTGYVIVGSGGSGSAVAKSSILLSEWGAPSSNVSFGSQRILNLADPVNDQDAATKNYVDAVASGLDAKPSARVKTAGALPANTRSGNVLTADVNGALTSIDGVTVAVNDIVLVTDESTGANNGLYVVDSLGGASSQWSMTRHEKADESSEVTPGMFVFIEEGTLYADTGWVLSNDGTVVLNVTALTFVQFSGSATFTAGNGLVKSGSTFHFAQTSAYTTGALPFASGSTSIGFDASNLSYDDANNLLTATNLKTTSTLKASTTSAGYAQQWQTAGDNILGIQVSDLGGSGVTAKFVGYSASHFVQTDSVLGWNSSYGHWYVDGALGIGQDAAADERLHVYQTLDGNVRAYVQNPNTGSSATAAMRLGTASGSYYLQAERANHKFSIIEDSTDVLTLHNQSVGVGTTSPSAGAIGGKVIHVQSTGETASVRVDRSDASTSGTLSMTSGNTENALYGTGAKPLAVYIDSTRAATFDNNGNFGLGTSSPDSRLHVHESSAGSVTAVGGTVATFESSGSSYLSILGSDGSAKGIFVGDTGHAYGGGLIYDDSNNLNGWTVRTNANNNRWHFTSLGHLNPAADDTYDIGSLSNQVQDVYISGDLYRDGVAVMTPHLLRNSNNTIDADGWYRVAKKTSGSGRSDFRLVVYSVGGNTGPSAAEFRIASDWTISASKLATVTLIHNGGVNNIESIRLVSDTVSGAFYVDLELFTSDNVSSPETFFIDIIEERQISGSVSYVDFTDLSTLGTNEVVISTLSVDDTRIGVADGGQDDIFRVRGNEILAGVPLRAADGSASAPSISFANDGNTGIYSAGDGNISLSINGTRKFQFDSGGEFRIEDDTPRIHLMESDTTDDNWRLMNTGGTFYISQTDNSTNLVAHALSITPDTQDLKVFGNVGINTSAAPTASLEVNGGTTGGDTLFKLGSRLTVSGSGVLEWGSGAAHGLLSWDTGEAIIGGLSGMGVSVVSNGGIEAMFVDTSQDVTIHNDVYLGEYLYHKSDTDTYLRFQTNQVDLSAGGGVLELTSTSLEIAEGIRLQSGSFSHLNLNVDTNGESVANSVYLTSNTNLVLVSDSNNNGTGNLIFGKGSEDYGVTDWTEFGRFTNAGALQIENLTASQYVKTDSNKRLISASSIPASDISGGTISGALSMTYLTQTLASGLETRSWAIAPNSGGGQFFLGYLEASDDQDGAISGVIHFANDYGETASQRLNFAFGQRDGSTWGHWWKEGSGSPADPVYIEVLDDGAGNMGIWAIAEDYARAHIEATGTSISSFTASGTLSDGTPPTTDTTLYDTRNAPEGWAKMESVRFGNGSASSPAITFESDTDCGWYRVGAGRPGLAADGVNVFNSTSSFAEFPNISRLLVPSGTGALPGIQALTDQDTGMFWPGSNTLAWSVGGVEELRLSASSLRPGSDAANTLGESTYRWSKVFAQAIDGGANSVTYESDIDHRFTVGGTEQMRLTSTGLGIGATPVSGARLNVNGHARIVGSNRLIFGDYTSNNDHGPYLSDNNTSGYFDIVTGYNTASGNEASNGIRFGKAKNTTWSTVMVLDTVDDRLGINNPSPSYTLDVTGTARFNNGSNQQVLISPVDGAIELVGSTPYIDFKDTTAEDFDIRLQRNGSNNIRFKNPSTTMFELSGTEAFLGGSTFTSGANLNITGQAASTGNRAGAIWMRGAVSDSIVQVNVRGGNFELGVGGSLDTAPPFAVDLQAGFTTVHELRVTDTGTGSSSPLIIRHWDTSDTDIDGLLPGSTFGKIIEGPSSAHVVVGLRENDSNDSFAIVSGGGDYDDDSTYDTLIARFGASGDVEIPNGSLTVGSTTLGRYTTTIGNGSSTSIGVTHNLGSKNLQIMLREVSTDEQVMVETVFTSTNVVTFEFTEAPGTNAIEVSIIAF